MLTIKYQTSSVQHSKITSSTCRNLNNCRIFLVLGCMALILKNHSSNMYDIQNMLKLGTQYKQIHRKHIPANADDKQELSLWINIKSTFQLCLPLQSDQFLFLPKKKSQHGQCKGKHRSIMKETKVTSKVTCTCSSYSLAYCLALL